MTKSDDNPLMNKPIRKAVFPVAGLGSRFLPATKANPKEMLPIVDKPLIQYAVDEAIAAGMTQLIFITSSHKRAIEDHFDKNHALELHLKEHRKNDLLSMVQKVLPDGVQCVYIRQPEPKGLGHAVLCAREVIGDEPFAVFLADDLIKTSDQNCIQQMHKIYHKFGGNVVAVEKINPIDSNKYGIIKVKSIENRIGLLDDIVEKPSQQEAPSNLAVAGRYLLQPRIFDHLMKTPCDKGGEIQLTDAIKQLLKEQTVHSLAFKGTRYDCGSKLGYIQATVAYALNHPDIGSDVHQYIQRLGKQLLSANLEIV